MGKTKKLLDGFQTNWWPRFIDTPTRPVNTCLGCIAFYAQARDGGGFWGGRGGGGGGDGVGVGPKQHTFFKYHLLTIGL
jgi:hypothetical protein